MTCRDTSPPQRSAGVGDLSSSRYDARTRRDRPGQSGLGRRPSSLWVDGRRRGPFWPGHPPPPPLFMSCGHVGEAPHDEPSGTLAGPWWWGPGLARGAGGALGSVAPGSLAPSALGLAAWAPRDGDLVRLVSCPGAWVGWWEGWAPLAPTPWVAGVAGRVQPVPLATVGVAPTGIRSWSWSCI